jgi:uncharacterized protein (TIGR03435 family)
MSKPLHKDASFWIVAITLVGVANVVQLNLGVPWLQQRAAAIRPAPRATNIVDQARGGLVLNQPTDLDYRKKTYPWQKPQFEPQLLQDAPPQVVLIPSEYNAPSGGWGTSSSNSAIGIRMFALYVLQSAYGWEASQQIIQADPLPAGQFDFIANLPSGSLAGLQAEIKKQWGLVASREVIRTNALLLKIDHTNAPGLRAVTNSAPPAQTEEGTQTVRTQLGSFLVPYLRDILRRPVIDQTGLNGVVDLQLPGFRAPGGQNEDAFEETRKMLLEQFGLDLVQTNTTVEVLVVKKAKKGNP